MLQMLQTQDPQPTLRDLVHELAQEEQALQKHKAKIDALKEQLLPYVTFPEGKKTATIVKVPYKLTVQKVNTPKWDQNKILTVVEKYPQANSFFRTEFKPISNVDIKNYIKYTNDAIAKALSWAFEEKETYNFKIDTIEE